MDAFYHRGPGETFEATAATTSPWDDNAQHAGPPLALIARVVDERHAGTMKIGRITIEVFGPIPKIDLTIETKVLRPGRRIEFIEARLRSGGKDALVANVWRFATLGEAPPAANNERYALKPPPGPEARMDMSHRKNGYFDAFEWRAAYGSSTGLGPAAVWCHTELPLFAGEPKRTRDQLLALADSANGVSLEMPLGTWLSIPSSVTVTFARDPAGEWSYLEANSQIGPDGRGVTTGIIGDENGVVGNIVQALLVSPRPR